MKKLLCDKSNRKTIAILAGNLNTYYDSFLSKSVKKATLERDINLLIMICGSMNTDMSYKYEYQSNIMYYMLSEECVDGLILLPSIIYNYSKKSELSNILQHYKKTPLVTVNEPVEGHPGILVDNSSGIRELVSHLFHEHGKRNFAFVGGPKNNTEAQIRLEGFLQGMKDVGLEVDPRAILPGDFWKTGGVKAVRQMEESGLPWPEVIVCSNDYAAFGVYEELKKRNITIPNDIAVTGFDNIAPARYSFPPLTSIEQPLEQVAYKAVELLEQIINGKSVAKKTVLPTRVVYRWSTACSRWNLKCSGKKVTDQLEPQIKFKDIELKNRVSTWLEQFKTVNLDEQSVRVTKEAEFIDLLYLTVSRHEDINFWDDLLFNLRYILDKYNKVDENFLTIMQCRIAEIRELFLGLTLAKNSTESYVQAKAVQRILSVFVKKDLKQEISDQIPRLGIKSFFMSMYPRPFNHKKDETWDIPKTSTFFCGYCRGEEITLPEKTLFHTRKLIPENISLPDEPMAFIMMAASFREAQFGYILMEASIEDEQVYTNLGIQISTAYRSILIFNEREQKTKELNSVLEQLRKSNLKLEEMSTHDSLTGLYNRRGFLLLGEKYHEMSLRNGTDYILFYADMDGLKAINDTWGHSEGDKAIRDFAKILKSTIRDTDIIARLGGDEFTVCTPNTRSDSAQVIENRLFENIEKYNINSGNQWKMDFSIGHVIHSDQPKLSFFEKMSLADERLYNRKRSKKAKTI
ncbi:GGDEF domain-containing protein [Chitinispirillales bacterium ANBcel5]|uniref:substrate-binding and GGDEF domain-containing protein n=1 Tax=Cellulosispirillum alkaliphilum TaxID=3039283 RepID=UPI002A52B5A3|nr:GGDEF domain-containing protein [Chitinispirillales bacterium ANBcel5]